MLARIGGRLCGTKDGACEPVRQARLQPSPERVPGRDDHSREDGQERLRDEASFTANDVEAICEVLGEDLLGLISAAVRRMRSGG